jgi:hypothetical protein
VQNIRSMPRSASKVSFQDVPSLRRTDSVPSINEYIDRPPLSRLPKSLSHAGIARKAVPLAPVPESPSPSKSPVKQAQPLKPILKNNDLAKSGEQAEPEDAVEEVKEDKDSKKKQRSVFKRMIKKFGMRK